MDAVLTVTIVAAAALWAARRLFRRRPGSCDGACSGCPGAGRPTTGLACPPSSDPLALPTRNDRGR